MRAVERPAPRSVVDVRVEVVMRRVMSKWCHGLRVRRRSVGIGEAREGGRGGEWSTEQRQPHNGLSSSLYHRAERC